MEEWEKEGFASKEAYERYQQTIKDLKDKEDKLTRQVDEKQKLIDSNRSTISELKDAEKERDELKKKQEEAEAERVKREEEAEKLKQQRTPEKIKEANNQRIAQLDPKQREEFKKQFAEGTPEQKKLLSTPEGIEAFLDMQLKVKEQGSDNPFDVTPKATTKDITQQIAEAFGKADKGKPAVYDRHGSGFDPDNLPANVKTRQEKVDDKVDEARSFFM
jgi:alanyl-tRNA synthetase